MITLSAFQTGGKWCQRRLSCFCPDALVRIYFFLVRLEIDEEFFPFEFRFTVTGADNAEPFGQPFCKFEPFVFVND